MGALRREIRVLDSPGWILSVRITSLASEDVNSV